MTDVIAVSNGKGGVFKSSITANLAGLVALTGSRVMVVDMDRQGHQSMDLGVEDQNDGGRSMVDAVLGNRDRPDIVSARPGLDVIAGGKALAELDTWIALKPSRIRAFGDVLSRLDSYDLVLIDCSPAFPNLARSVYLASDAVLIPSMVDDGSRSGLDSVGDEMAEAAELGGTAGVLGVVLTGVGRSASTVERTARAEFTADLQDTGVPLLETVIHGSLATATLCRRKGLLVHELEEQRSNSAGSGLADDYQSLAKEVLDAIKALRTERGER